MTIDSYGRGGVRMYLILAAIISVGGGGGGGVLTRAPALLRAENAGTIHSIKERQLLGSGPVTKR